MRVFSDFEDQASNGTGESLRHDPEPVERNLASIKAILVLASAKGGTGKSLLAVNIAGALAHAGKKVGVVDADLNAPSILRMLGAKVPLRYLSSEGIEPAAAQMGIRVISAELLTESQRPAMSFLDDETPPPPVAVAPARLTHSQALRRMLSQTRFGPLDLLIIDLAPGAEELLRLMRIFMPTGVMLITHASGGAASAMRHLLDLNKEIGAPIVGAIENMVGFGCDNCRSVRPLFPHGETSGIARAADIPIVARLTFDPRFAESPERGKIFVNEFSETPIGKQLIDMARQIDAMLTARIRKASAATAPTPAPVSAVLRQS
ncbi:MAG TPA: P-loop NTPase [Candidatus Binataceae bacterium]|nr:P-loop NTPase [Candidatus Binataceae bacterium]